MTPTTNEAQKCKCDLRDTKYATAICDHYKAAKGRAAEMAWSVPGACTTDSPDEQGACGHDRACHTTHQSTESREGVVL